jgi:hypothetical protein
MAGDRGISYLHEKFSEQRREVWGGCGEVQLLIQAVAASAEVWSGPKRKKKKIISLVLARTGRSQRGVKNGEKIIITRAEPRKWGSRLKVGVAVVHMGDSGYHRGSLIGQLPPSHPPD